jgi:hypothetical protein
VADVDDTYYDDDDELRLNFSGVDDIQPMELIPSGIQHCTITKADKVPAGPNAKFPGQPVLSLEFTVASGDYEGRKIWDRIAVGKDSLYKEDGEPSFGFQKLKSLLGALRYDNTGDLRFRIRDWLDQHVDVRVGRKSASFGAGGEEYPAKNTAVAFYPHEISEAEALR